MSVSEKDVERIATLSKLQFNDEGKTAIQQDMNKIIDFIGKLDELDTDNVEPLLFMTDEVNVLRLDESRNDVSQKEALKNAPQKDSDYFKIPKVLG